MFSKLKIAHKLAELFGGKYVITENASLQLVEKSVQIFNPKVHISYF